MFADVADVEPTQVGTREIFMQNQLLKSVQFAYFSCFDSFQCSITIFHLSSCLSNLNIRNIRKSGFGP